MCCRRLLTVGAGLWEALAASHCRLDRRSVYPPCFPETGVLLFGACGCRAQAILALLRDEGRLAAEREAHARKRGTYQGFSSLDMAQASMA